MLEEEPFLLVAVRSLLFLMFFLISVYLSFDRDMLLFWLTTGGMGLCQKSLPQQKVKDRGSCIFRCLF